MITIEPATLHRADDGRLSELAGTLAGQRLVGARYVTPAGTGWSNYSDIEGVHDVGMGVELVTETGLGLELSWATPGRKEGLSLTLGREEERISSDLVDLVDVSGHQDWLGIIGSFVEMVAVSFCIHSDDLSVRPWSVRVGLSNGSSVTVALGETEGNFIRYLPDNIVVILNEAAARGYEIADGLQPAWGEVVPHAE
ncbi:MULTISPECIES: hypothetical protein [unclassified Micromonospora]|uniref:hypothetical protein n=1 Tax=unclassified Micromonospora TaxID=2617518 RepID=UPI00362A45AA